MGVATSPLMNAMPASLSLKRATVNARLECARLRDVDRVTKIQKKVW